MKNICSMLLVLICFKGYCLQDNQWVKYERPTKKQKIELEKKLYEKRIEKIKKSK